MLYAPPPIINGGGIKSVRNFRTFTVPITNKPAIVSSKIDENHCKQTLASLP